MAAVRSLCTEARLAPRVDGPLAPAPWLLFPEAAKRHSPDPVVEMDCVFACVVEDCACREVVSWVVADLADAARSVVETDWAAFTRLRRPSRRVFEDQVDFAAVAVSEVGDGGLVVGEVRLLMTSLPANAWRVAFCARSHIRVVEAQRGGRMFRLGDAANESALANLAGPHHHDNRVSARASSTRPRTLRSIITRRSRAGRPGKSVK